MPIEDHDIIVARERSRVLEEAARLSASMISSAASGSLEIEALVENILQSLARLALEEFVFDPLDRWIETLGETVIGARATGGPVMGGERYLVGERGPEVFTPSSAGTVSPLAAAPPVNITIIAGSGREAEAVRRSQRQISAAVARAVQAGSASL